jgi:ABC-type spermidine/putrescine transport system permease subunit II
MGLADNFRKMSTSMIVLHVASKVIIGIGLGALLAEWIAPVAWWLVIAGIVLSIPPIYLILKGE